MTTQAQPKAPKERSKSFPVVPLKAAIERLQQFEAKFGRHPAPYEKSGLAWGMEDGSSQANRYLAALKAFGLVDYNASGKERTVSISESGRTYLRAQQESIKKGVLKTAALKPKQIARFWPTWGTDRPPNEVCIDDLVMKYGFTPASAPQFLKVYDETIAYAGLSSSDKVASVDNTDDDDDEEQEEPVQGVPATPGEAERRLPPLAAAIPMLAGERVLTTGLLARDASFKLIVSGRVGPKEIDILIRKLQLDKEILADPEANQG